MNTSVSCRVRTLAVLTLLSAAGPGPASAADGTIHFVGAIVAAPYAFSVLAPPAGTGRLKTDSRSEVVFERQWIDRPSARVAVLGLDGHPIDLAFTDSRGQLRPVSLSEDLIVGRDGGSLSLGRPAPGRSNASALLTVTYD